MGLTINKFSVTILFILKFGRFVSNRNKPKWNCQFNYHRGKSKLQNSVKKTVYTKLIWPNSIKIGQNILGHYQ